MKKHTYASNLNFKEAAKVLRKKLHIIIGSAFLVMGIATSAFSLNANASSVSEGNDYKYYANYCIEPGDTLWGIASEHMDYDHYDSVKDYAKEIQKINHISADKIVSGNYIMVPYYSEELK